MRLSLVPKSTLDPLLTKLEQAGIRPSRLEIADGPDQGLSLPLEGNGGRVASCLGIVCFGPLQFVAPPSRLPRS